MHFDIYIDRPVCFTWRMTDTAPWPISDTVHPIAIGEHLMACIGTQPVLLKMTGSEDWYLPLFSTLQKLQTAMTLSGAPFDAIKQIDDPTEFLANIPYRHSNGLRLRIIVDLHQTVHGTIRYAEVLRGH